MKFGICYNVDYHPDVHGTPADYYNRIISQCALLEDLGYYSAWFSEHHSGPYSFGNPALMIAAASQRTKTLKLGTGVSLLPLHQPVVLSEEYGMLDQLTGGRLEYGIGRGFLFHEYPWLGVPVPESHARYREAVAFIKKAWTAKPGERISFDGEFSKIEGYNPFPGVVQKPYPPIFGSAVSEESFVFAAANNLDIGLSVFVTHPSVLATQSAFYKKSLEDHGFSRADRTIMGITQMYCSENDAEARSTGKRLAENYFKFFADLVVDTTGVGAGAARMREVDAGVLNDNNQTLFGSPDVLIQKIQRMRDEWDCDYLQLEVAQGGCPPDEVERVLRLFGEKVIPHFS